MTKDMKLKFASAIALCGFSVVALVLGTFAWFTAARVKNNQQDSISVVNPSGLFKQMTIHNAVNVIRNVNIVEEQEVVTYTYQFNQTAEGTVTYNPITHKPGYTGNTNISMGVYDLLDRHHPVLLLIELIEQVQTTAEIGVSVSATTESSFLGESTAEEPVAVNGNPLSSVVESFSSGYTQAELNALKQTNGYSYTDPDTEETTNYNTINIAGQDDTVAFAQFDNNDNYTGFDPEISLYNAPQSTTLQYVGIVFDFYEEALEYIYNTFLGNEILEDRVGFTCDWEMII